jgi:hypothetical protein
MCVFWGDIMACEFRLKDYCFHPERASGELVAINCVYSWINRMADENKSRKLIQSNG